MNDEDVDLKDFTEIKVAVSFLLQKAVHVLFSGLVNGVAIGAP